MDSDSRLRVYYAARAREYDRIYDKPERQPDLARLREIVGSFGKGLRVLEVACGTGYWTEVLAPVAASVTAIDASEEVLELARARALGPAVLFRRADAYALQDIPGEFDAVLAGFWWSHVPLAEMQRFLKGVNARLHLGGRGLFIDNRYVEGSSTRIARSDEAGNTYQCRVLSGGEAHDVLKNFPTAREVRNQLSTAGAAGIHVGELSYYWYASHEVGPSGTTV